MKTIAIVGCMDRRLNLFFEKERDRIAADNPDNNVYVLRDAGGGVEAVRKTILGLRVSEIHDYTHTNCGAMKVALSTCSKLRSGSKLDEIEGGEDFYKSIVEPLVNGNYMTPVEIEQGNTKVQMDALEHFRASHPELKTSCELIDIDKISVPNEEREHTLIIGMAFSGRYSDMASKWNLELQSTYFVQANHLDEVRLPVKLAVEKLNIRNVMFVSNGRSENTMIEEWSNDAQFRRMFEKNLTNEMIKMENPQRRKT